MTVFLFRFEQQLHLHDIQNSVPLIQCIYMRCIAWETSPVVRVCLFKIFWWLQQQIGKALFLHQKALTGFMNCQACVFVKPVHTDHVLGVLYII